MENYFNDEMDSEEERALEAKLDQELNDMSYDGDAASVVNNSVLNQSGHFNNFKIYLEKQYEQIDQDCKQKQQNRFQNNKDEEQFYENIAMENQNMLKSMEIQNENLEKIIKQDPEHLKKLQQEYIQEQNKHKFDQQKLLQKMGKNVNLDDTINLTNRSIMSKISDNKSNIDDLNNNSQVLDDSMIISDEKFIKLAKKRRILEKKEQLEQLKRDKEFEEHLKKNQDQKVKLSETAEKIYKNLQQNGQEDKVNLDEKFKEIRKKFEDQEKQELQKSQQNINKSQKFNFKDDQVQKQFENQVKQNGQIDLEASMISVINNDEELQNQSFMSIKSNQSQYKLQKIKQDNSNNLKNINKLQKKDNISQLQSIQFKKEKEIQQKKDKMIQERELMFMEQEDFLSLEYEEFLHKKLFTEKNYNLPETFNDYSKYDENMDKEMQSYIGDLDFEQPSNIKINILPNLTNVNEENLAPENSKDLCLNRLKEMQRYKRRKFQGVKKQKIQITNQEQIKKSFQIQQNKDQNIKCSNFIINLLKKDQNLYQKIFQNAQNKDRSKQVVYFEKCINLQQQYIQQKQKIFMGILENHKIQVPKLLNTYFDDEELNVFYDLEEEENEEQLKKSGILSQPKSLQNFLEDDIFNNYEKTTKLQLKLENIADVKGISKLQQSLQILTLSVNKISVLDEIQTCKNLIEINLAQNKIQKYSALGELVELRLLNLEFNEITEISELKNCQNLQILNLNSNKIQKINNLKHIKLLKSLYLFKNQILKIENLENLLLLEDLDLSNNKLQILENLENNILLKKLSLQRNNISEIKMKLSFFFLNSLLLHYNKITDISQFQFCPCLEILNLSFNQIEKCTSTDNHLICLPNIKQLNISYNKISNFSELWNFVKYSPKINIFRYQENEFLRRNNSDDMLELYEYLFIQQMQGIQDINDVKNDKGHKIYLSVKFKNILKQNQTKFSFQNIQQNQIEQEGQNHQIIQEFAGIINRFNYFTRENQFIQQFQYFVIYIYISIIKLQNCYILFNYVYNLFFQQIINLQIYMSKFFLLQKINLYKQQQFIKQYRQIENNKVSIKHNIYTQIYSYFQFKSMLSINHLKSLQQQKTKGIQIFQGKQTNIFHENDIFYNKQLRAHKKVNSSLILWIYKRRKLNKYFGKYEPKIIKIQSILRGHFIRKRTNLGPIIKEIRFKSKAKYAIKIQKVFKGYLIRKKIKNIIQPKYEDIDDDLEDFDGSWIDKEPTYDTGLELIDGFDIESFITPSNILQQAKNIPSQQLQKNYKRQQNKQKYNLQDQQITEEDEFQNSYNNDDQNQNQNDNNQDLMVESLNSASDFRKLQNNDQNYQQQQQQQYKQPSFKVTDKEKQDIMQDWHFENPQAAQALAFRMEKKRKMLQQKNKKKLTAAEKYEIVKNQRK